MITREQIYKIVTFKDDSQLLGSSVSDAIMKLIVDERNKRDNQYQELVDAAVMWHKFMGHNDRNHEMTADIPKGLADAVKPFIKLSLSEKITKLSDMWINSPQDTAIALALKELAEEAKTLEQERELMKYT